MPNNPYSPEAIQKRLSVKSASSLFDSLTSRSKDSDIETPETPTRPAKATKPDVEIVEQNYNDEMANGKIVSQTESLDSIDDFGAKNTGKDRSPSPHDAHDLLTEETSQYKRYIIL